MWTQDLLLSLFVPVMAFLSWPLVRRRVGDPALAEGPAGYALALALALGWLQTGGTVMVLGGWLETLHVWAWMGLGLILAGLFGRPMGLPTPWTRPPDWLIVLLICALPIFLLALVPPWYRDSMVYHLALPREYAQAGGMIRVDDNIFASFPLGYESILAMLHVLGEAPDYDPPFNPRLIGAWVSLGAALATVGLARILGAGARLAAVSGVVMVLTPTWMEFGASCYVEPYLVLLSTLALCCAVRMVEGVERPGLFMALLLGLAAGVKYPGLAVLFFVLIGVLILQLRRARSQRGDLTRVLFGWLPLVATALVLAAPFYMRNLLERGNPVFPLGYELFGGEGWDSTRAWMYAETLKAYGEGRGLLDTLMLPLRLFTATDLRTGFQGSIGPVPLMLIALGAWRMRAERGSAHVLVFGFGITWAIFWAMNVQQVRFFLVALSPLLALGAWGLSRCPLREIRIGLSVAAGGLMFWAAEPLEELWNHQRTGAWLTDEITQSELHTEVMPWTYRPYQELETYVPEDGKIWLVDTRAHTYYLRRDYRLDCVFEEWRFVESLAAGEGTESLEAELRDEGFSHLLINHALFLSTVEDSQRSILHQRFRSLRQRGVLQEEASWQIIEGEAGKTRPMVLYRVVFES